jgi:hypothetical protein
MNKLNFRLNGNRVHRPEDAITSLDFSLVISFFKRTPVCDMDDQDIENAFWK